MLKTLARCSEPAALYDHGWPTVIRVPTPNNSFLHETAAAAAAQVQEPAVEVLDSQPRDMGCGPWQGTSIKCKGGHCLQHGSEHGSEHCHYCAQRNPPCTVSHPLCLGRLFDAMATGTLMPCRAGITGTSEPAATVFAPTAPCDEPSDGGDACSTLRDEMHPFLLLLFLFRTQPHLGCCLAEAQLL
jgi:hypothetical protein